jgi:SsrA-binding protein
VVVVVDGGGGAVVVVVGGAVVTVVGGAVVGAAVVGAGAPVVALGGGVVVTGPGVTGAGAAVTGAGVVSLGAADVVVDGGGAPAAIVVVVAGAVVVDTCGGVVAGAVVGAAAAGRRGAGAAKAAIVPTSPTIIVALTIADSALARRAGCRRSAGFAGDSTRRRSSSARRAATSSRASTSPLPGASESWAGPAGPAGSSARTAPDLQFRRPFTSVGRMAASRRGDQQVITNRRARHEYFIEDRYECGIVLAGSEVKSLRNGRANLQDAYARVVDGEVWLYGMHVSPYEFSRGDLDPVRRRKLLLHHRQIAELAHETERKGVTLVPLRVYFKDGRAKVELGIGRGKRQYDKRQTLAERDARREAERALKGVRE